MAGSGDAHLRGPTDALLRVEHLVQEFPLGKTGKRVHAVSDVSIDLRKGETLGLVGESGCGKSTTGKAIMQLPPPTSGAVLYDGVDLTTLSPAELRRVRPEMQMIFQDPISSLNPRRTVGDIVAEPLRIWAAEHNPPAAATRTVTRLLNVLAGVAVAGFVLLAVFWLLNSVIPYIANTEVSVLRPFWESLRNDALALTASAVVIGGAAYGVGRGVRDRVNWSRWATLALAVVVAVPTAASIAGSPLTTFPAFGQAAAVQATVSSDDFTRPPPDDLLPGQEDLISAELTVDGDEVTVQLLDDDGRLAEEPLVTTIAAPARTAQLVLTLLGLALALAPAALSLLPAARRDFARMGEVRGEHDSIVRRTLENVGLDPDGTMGRRPHQFSGGQCQRICIARALVLDPKVIICDEPVSALDVSVQAQILNLLEEMKQRYDLTIVFIAHDLAVVKNVSDRVAVMYLGKVCEVAGPDSLYQQPAHPYTAALLASIPVPDPTVRPRTENILGGELPSPVAPPSGCRFRTRCPRAEDVCAQVEPKMRKIGLSHFVACHFPLEAEPRERPTAASTATTS